MFIGFKDESVLNTIIFLKFDKLPLKFTAPGAKLNLIHLKFEAL